MTATKKRTRKDARRDSGELLPPTFRALADPTRMKIMLMLEGKPRTVSQIVDFFDVSQPTISRHLQILTRAGLVRRVRKGQRVYYSVDEFRMETLCVSLAACFPCCRVEVVPLRFSLTESTEKGKDVSRKTRTKKTTSKRKGAGK
ncbi:MAG: ArsR/SmtB family transcription factor [Candidatus Zixiibacteriota bacterium]